MSLTMNIVMRTIVLNKAIEGESDNDCDTDFDNDCENGSDTLLPH